jgi:hypothetical protein
MARPWPRSLRDWYRRSSHAELAIVAARRLSADLTAVRARSGIGDARRALIGPPVRRSGPTRDHPATTVSPLVFPTYSEAAPPPHARPASDTTVRPAVAPVDVDDIGAEDDGPPPSEIPLPGRPGAPAAPDDDLRGLTDVGPDLAGDRNGRVRRDEPGRWLILRDALREIGSLEHLYELARDGKLQSREGAVGQVEVWVADRDRFGGILTRPPGAVGSGDSCCSEAEHQVLALAASLVENHERHLELARENGALGERVAQLERQLEELTRRPTRRWGDEAVSGGHAGRGREGPPW